jgi:hypothetical protein
MFSSMKNTYFAYFGYFAAVFYLSSIIYRDCEVTSVADGLLRLPTLTSLADK